MSATPGPDGNGEATHRVGSTAAEGKADGLPTGESLIAAIGHARAQHRAGAGAVLDILLRSVPDLPGWGARLSAEAGVDVLRAPDEHLPDFDAWPTPLAQQYRIVAARSKDGRLIAAAEDPWDHDAVRRLSRHAGAFPVVMATRREVLTAWLGDGTASAAHAEPGDGVLADGPIVQFVAQALRVGFSAGASDVHFECDRRGVQVKHRLDGVMVRYARLDDPRSAHEVISRIKVLAALDITERRLPQDGRFRMGLGDAEVDLRVSIMPSVHGEDAVLRLLDKGQSRARSNVITLATLGFQAASAEAIGRLAELPSGMLLVTGPTGSGKTTTVYAALSQMNTGLEKIITIEDPVEYELPGVLQIPVNERKGLSFAKGLRSILRHDPDRILVGEIRDAETAEIAVQSALTGHLVLTTVHANSVSDVIGRFRHFGLDTYGFMSALNGVVVQRLLRRLCSSCAVERPATEAERELLTRALFVEGELNVPRPIGCPDCHGTGYKGRFVVGEVHSFDDELRDSITAGAPLSALRAHAARQQVEPLLHQVLRRVLDRQTTLDELHRVIGGA